MSFRMRIALLGAAAVAVAVAVASAITFAIVRGELRSQLDDSLRSRAEAVDRMRIEPGHMMGSAFLALPPPMLGAAPGYLQVVTGDGEAVRPRDATIALPVTGRDRAVAQGVEAQFFADRDVAGTHMRVYTVPVGAGFALQVARPLDEVDGALSRIRAWLLAVALAGIAIAAALGLLLARTFLRPVRRLTVAAEDVAATGDLSRRIDDRGSDELARLATTFNAMLAALEESARAQRRLVSDASHELRTPLTSLRTNIEVLAGKGFLPAADRKLLLSDVTEQLGEMTALIAELVELARGDRPREEPEDVRLDLLVADAVERARRDRPGVTIETGLEFEETWVRGVPGRLERAISNLLDNAAKWSPPDGVVEVAVREAAVVVRDRGPGIAAEDVPFVFDRFYRAAAARSLPGSGLGLAIVRQVAEEHGGTIAAGPAAGGGTTMTLTLPPFREPEATD